MDISKEITIEVSDSWGDTIVISNSGVLPGTNEKGILIDCVSMNKSSGKVSFTKEDIDEFIKALHKAREAIL
ncbi:MULTISPECIES: hypothetical protein [Bacillus cereus group]|uniref:DUF3006 domain-containing protein n=1 Tax=Bacillus thuringiensis serovar toumanoffi TaxID=180862 RepID=A0ABD5IAJ9_BACTU|nr:hypothetical protein [Bacillus thuringiensis]AMR88307.1 hypothetical protein A3L20_30325 [Bacillus thuringiensis]MBG9637454.1 hypothetical protein [Bacillus thuringiensis]MBG9673982.1 hypothetical protein [Bacillus thuringiensis]MCR6784326.1 hypothetical protein [Bacillus thuringiensis]MCR6863140.1 hypothetical protein [Bacillus thuringiensis]